MGNNSMGSSGDQQGNPDLTNRMSAGFDRNKGRIPERNKLSLGQRPQANKGNPIIKVIALPRDNHPK